MVIREQGILTPQVQTQAADLTQSNMTNQLSDFAFNTADVLRQKANHRNELEFKNQAQEEINAIFERNQSNPEQFQREATAAQRALGKNAPLFMREQFKEAFETQARPYLNKATDNHEMVLTDEIKFSTLKRVDLAKQSMTMFAGELFSKNPIRQADALQGSQGLILDTVGAVTAVDGRGQPVLGASERFKITKDLIDDVAFFSVRSGYDSAVDKEAYMREFQSGELKAAIFMDEEGNFIERPVRDGMDITLFERTTKNMQSDIDNLKIESLRQEIRQEKLKYTDPQQAAIEAGARNVDEGIAMQQKMGVQPGNIDIYSKDQSTKLATQINGIIDPDIFIQTMGELRDEVGAKNWTRALENLADGGMSKELQFATLPNASSQSHIVTAMFNMGQKGGAEAVKKLALERASGDNTVLPSIKNNVSSKIEQLTGTLLKEGGGLEHVQNVSDQVTNIANYFYAIGKSQEDSVELATEWLTGKYIYAKINGEDVRVINAPETDIDEVESGLENRLKILTKEDLHLNQPSNFQLEGLKRNGGFTLDEETGGYFLRDILGRAVIDKDGEPLYISPKQIDDLGGKTVRLQKKLFREQVELLAKIKADVRKTQVRLEQLKGN